MSASPRNIHECSLSIKRGGGIDFSRCISGSLSIEVLWSSHIASFSGVYVECVRYVDDFDGFIGLRHVGL